MNDWRREMRAIMQRTDEQIRQRVAADAYEAGVVA